MTVTPAWVSLTGRTALVTGAANGIGRATALAFAAFGADVAVCDRDEANLSTAVKEIEALGRRAFPAILDVRDGDAVRVWVKDLARVDVLVNNAGGGFVLPFLDVSPKGQSALVDENFTSVTHFVRACLPKMPPAPQGGSIINVTSIEAFRASPGFGVYGAMKAAVEQLTRTLALELSPRRIRVNTIAPDAIPTPGDEGLGASVGVGTTVDYGAKVPLGWGEADDCAAAAVYLACDLSRYVTGTTIHVDGGSLAASGWTRRDDDVWQP